jgi:hypothetical protein
LNGNTFATIARELALALFSELSPLRKRELSSAVGHYVAGVLDREAMIDIVNSLWQSAQFTTGDRVKTFKGTLRGVVVQILDDGRVKWRAKTGAVLIALPESLIRDD